ncbi:hypothetical protein [Nocardia sp. NPDC057440]
MNEIVDDLALIVVWKAILEDKPIPLIALRELEEVMAVAAAKDGF